MKFKGTKLSGIRVGYDVSSPLTVDEVITQAKNELDAATAGFAHLSHYQDDMDEYDVIIAQAESIKDTDPDGAISIINNYGFADKQINHMDDLRFIHNDITDLPLYTTGTTNTCGCWGDSNFMVANWYNLKFSRGLISGGRLGKGRFIFSADSADKRMEHAFENPYDGNERQEFELNMMKWLTERSTTQFTGSDPINVIYFTRHSFNPLPEYNINEIKIENIDDNAAVFDPAVNPLFVMHQKPDTLIGVNLQIVLDYIEAGGAVVLGIDCGTEDRTLEDREHPIQIWLGGLKLAWHGGSQTDDRIGVSDLDVLFRSNLTRMLEYFDFIEENYEDHARYGWDEADAPEYRTSIYRTMLLVHDTTGKDWWNNEFRRRLNERNTGYATAYTPTPEDVAFNILSVVEPLLSRCWADQEADPGVANYTGLIGATVPRISRTVEFDYDLQVVNHIKYDHVPHGWSSTGLYVPPGENITVNVRPGPDFAGDLTAPALIMRVASQDDTLSSHASLRRPRVISNTHTLYMGESTLSSAFGGALMFSMTASSNDPANLHPWTIEIDVDGCVEMPVWIYGTHTNEDWETMKQMEVPECEVIVPGRAIIHENQIHYRNVVDIEATAANYEAFVDAENELHGLELGADIPHNIDPKRPWRYTSDRHISAGGLHSGYPVMDSRSTNGDGGLVKNGLGWGLFHELGHNFQYDHIALVGSNEVTCNLYSLYSQYKLGITSRLLENDTFTPIIDEIAANGSKTYADGGAFEKLVCYDQLRLQYGEVHGYDNGFNLWILLHKKIRDDELASGDQQDRNDFLAVETARLFSLDTRSFFDAWEIVLSQTAIDTIVAMGHPEPTTPIWQLKETVDWGAGVLGSADYSMKDATIEITDAEWEEDN